MISLIKVDFPADQTTAETIRSFLQQHVSTDPSRAGNVTRVRVLTGAHTDSAGTLLLIGETSGPVGIFTLLGRQFEAGGAQVQDVGDFEDLTDWMPGVA